MLWKRAGFWEMPQSTKVGGIESGMSESDQADGIEGLDLGGLRVSDFSDPDTGCENGVGDPYDEAGLDCDELNSTDWESIVGEAELETRDSTGVQLEIEAEQTAMSRGEDEETIKLATLAAEISISELASESEVSELFQTPAVTTGATADPDTSSSPTDLDSPLPISRAGPVIIPQLGSHHLPSRTIRADPGSPFRPLSRLSSPAQAYTSLSDTAAEAAILLGQLDSPNSSPVRAESKPAIIMTPLHLAPQPTNATPSTAKPTAFVVGSDAVARNNKILKPSLAGFTIPGSLDRSKSGPSEKKVVARTLAIRGQLDAAFQPKMGTMGPPQRAVSSSSASSSSSSSSFGQQRPHSRLGAAGPSKPSRPLGRSADLSISREVSPKRSIAGAKPPASRPQQYMAGFNRSLAINKGTIECSPVTVTSSTAARSRSAFAPSALNGAARPALAPRLLSQPMGRSSVSIGVSSKVSRPPPMPKPVTIVKPTKPITASPQKMIGDPLKRPLALAQPQMARLPIAANGLHVTRPTLGLPSRFVRETSSMQATAVFSIGVGGGGERFGLGNPSLSRAGFRSPVRPLVKRPVADASLGTPAGLRVMKVSAEMRA